MVTSYRATPTRLLQVYESGSTMSAVRPIVLQPGHCRDLSEQRFSRWLARSGRRIERCRCEIGSESPEAVERMGRLRGDCGELNWIDTVGSVPENLSSVRHSPLDSVDADSENVRCTEPAMWVDREVPYCETDLLLRWAVSTDSRLERMAYSL